MSNELPLMSTVDKNDVPSDGKFHLTVAGENKERGYVYCETTASNISLDEFIEHLKREIELTGAHKVELAASLTSDKKADFLHYFNNTNFQTPSNASHVSVTTTDTFRDVFEYFICEASNVVYDEPDQKAMDLIGYSYSK